MDQIGGSMCGKKFMKELQPLYLKNSKAWRRLCYSVGRFCQLQSQGFAPDEGQIESDMLSQHTVASRDPIWNAACG